jgi:hypothetical protein
MDNPAYETPRVEDYGDLADLTANNAIPVFVDVPQGSPATPGPIVGDEPFPEMS